MIRKHTNNEFILAGTLAKQEECFISGPSSIAENLRLRLQFWRGGSFFAADEGVDWLAFIGSAATDLTDLTSQIIAIARKSAGVIGVNSLKLDRRSRNIAIVIDYKDIYNQSNELKVTL